MTEPLIGMSLDTLIALGALLATACGLLAGLVQAGLAHAFGLGSMKSDVRAIRKAMQLSQEQQVEERERHDRAMEAVWHEFGVQRNAIGEHSERLATVESRLSVKRYREKE